MKTPYLDKEITILESYKKEGIASFYQLRKLAEYREIKQLMLGGVSKCNAVKDPNIVKTWLLISREDGLTDVWHKGKCLGKGLDAEGINKLNL